MDKTGFLDMLDSRFADLTPTGKRIAGYLLANPQKLPFETADSIAQQTDTTGISVGRFLRSLGYRNIDDVKKACVTMTTAPGSSLTGWGRFVRKRSMAIRLSGQ